MGRATELHVVQALRWIRDNEHHAAHIGTSPADLMRLTGPRGARRTFSLSVWAAVSPLIRSSDFDKTRRMYEPNEKGRELLREYDYGARP